jgi:hypothetical protein
LTCSSDQEKKVLGQFDMVREDSRIHIDNGWFRVTFKEHGTIFSLHVSEEGFYHDTEQPNGMTHCGRLHSWTDDAEVQELRDLFWILCGEEEEMDEEEEDLDGEPQEWYLPEEESKLVMTADPGL